jgi:tetratricopeptide (TPR) repeat protein
MSDDPRTEQEFRLSLGESQTCPDAYLSFSDYLSRALRFQEAVDMLSEYIRLEYRPDWRDRKNSAKAELLELRKAAHLKAAVDGSDKPALDDLLHLTHIVSGFGRRHGEDGMPYAQKAMTLYPDSADAILSFTKIKMLYIRNDQDREEVKLLLERAAVLAPENAEVYSTLGIFHVGGPVAEAYYNRALELNKRDTASWKGLGYIYLYRGQRQEAITALRTYLQLLKAKGAPVDTRAREAIHQLEQANR